MMWNTDRSSHTSNREPEIHNGSSGAAEMMEDEPPDASAFLRRNPGAQRLLDDMRRHVSPGGVILSPSSPTPASPTIGDRFTAELGGISRRERQIREIQTLAMCPVLDLTKEQLRQILEFMV